MKIMKIFTLALSLALFSFTTLATITWKNDVIDAGEIPQGKPKEFVFEYKNTGKTDLLITNVQGSCGCTATNYTKEVVKPGNSGTVTAIYNAANVGDFTKTVTVTTNADNTSKVLQIKGKVLTI